MSTAITLDLGPGHIAQVFEIDDETVCILAPEAATDSATQERVRQLLRGQGVDCEACSACPVGQAE